MTLVSTLRRAGLTIRKVPMTDVLIHMPQDRKMNGVYLGKTPTGLIIVGVHGLEMAIPTLHGWGIMAWPAANIEFLGGGCPDATKIVEVRCNHCDNVFFVSPGVEFNPRRCCYCETEFVWNKGPDGVMRNAAGMPMEKGPDIAP